MFRMRN